MANTVAISTIDGFRLEAEGSRVSRIVLLTLTADGSNYADGGIALPTDWNKVSGVNTVLHAAPQGMLIDSPVTVAYPFEIDLTNNKVILFALGATPAEAEPLAEYKDATAITVTATARVKLVGY